MSTELLRNSCGAVPGAGNVSKPAFLPSLSCRPEVGHLENNQIHIWSAALSDFDGELSLFRAMLSSAERKRAEKFWSTKDRNYYFLRRGIRRVILGHYLQQCPSQIEFSYGPFGKPEVKGNLTRSRLYFNDSHSGDLALYTVTCTCPIGIDIEKVGPVPHFEEISSRFFSPREAKTLMTLPTECRLEAFFACWTRKEAFLKSTGEGIGEGLANVEVTLAPWEKPEILRIAGESEARTHWQLRSLSPAPGYLAAVAFRHHNLVLSQWNVHTLLSSEA